MQTSNFAWAAGDHFSKPVSIARYAPKWYSGRRYLALAPTRQMLKMCENEYRVAYQEILDRLNPRKVYEDLGPDAVLICWEKAGEFCHRRLVAEWLEIHLGIKVPEVGPDDRQEKLF